ncbi:MAG: hypothetical protein QM765_49945 [Myxococcales bacterium]
MVRLLRWFLLSMVAAAVPCTAWTYSRPGVAASCAVALGVAWLGPFLFARLGMRLSSGLWLLWLLPFALAWGLGEGMGLFARLPWWDHVAHAAAGAMVFALVRSWTAPRLRAGRVSLELACVLAALAVGAAWEIGEFACDSWLGSATQAGNTDTMLDLVFDACGAAAAALALAASDLAGRVRFRLLPARERGA